MMSSNREEQRISQLQVDVEQLKYILLVFALSGLGIGLTGIAVLMNFGGDGVGGAILSGILSLIVFFVALLIGPVIAIIIGIQLSNTDSSVAALYPTNFLGSAIGYIVMVMLVSIILVFGMGMVVGNGGGATDGDAGTSGGTVAPETNESLFSPMDIVLPLLIFSIPTGLSGLGAVFITRGLAESVLEPGTDTTSETITTSSSSPQTSSATSSLELPDLTPSSIPSLSEVSFRSGIIFGVIGFALTVLLVLIVLLIDPVMASDDGSLFTFGLSTSEFGLDHTSNDTAKFLTWMVFLAHGVPVQNLEFELVRHSLFQLTPVIALVALGWVASLKAETDSLLSRVQAGVSITSGYLLLVVIAAIFTTTTVSPQGANFISGGVVTVDFFAAVVKAGILYPVIFGAIGGLLSTFQW